MYLKTKKLNFILGYIFLVSLFSYITYVVFIDHFENYSNGIRTIIEYNVSVSLFLLVIFFFLSKVQSDVSKDQLKLELEIQKRTKKLNEYLNIVNQYVSISSTDLEGNITSVSEAFCEISGYTKEELIGQSHNIIRHPDTDCLFYENLWETIIANKKWEGELLNKKKNGDDYWIFAYIEALYSDDGEKIGYTSIRQDITDRKRVEKLSITDKLTQVYNRVKLEEIFTIEIAKFRRYNTSFSMILMDIDHFKEVNDTHGHNVGDMVLKEMSNVLKSSVRIEDIVGRWGGEEFIILTSNYSEEGVMTLAEKIRKNVESHDFAVVGAKTVSLGVSMLNHSDTQETLIERADKSLYYAKKNGRNQVGFL